MNAYMNLPYTGFSPLFLALIACNSRSVVKDAQCSTEEQSMFSECLSSGCSPSYSQDLSGADSCEYDASGSVVKVESGAECGFTSSGACYVVCACPDGSEVSFDVDTSGPEVDYEGDNIGECLDGADNDRDGLYDCDDPDCHGSPDCNQETDDTGSFKEDTGAFEEDTGSFEEDTGGDETPDEGSDLDGDGYSIEDGDCNDGNPAVNPSASDVVGDSIDQNCDGIDGTDVDADGFASVASGGDDCDDFDAVINPDFGVVDIEDYVDSNCDGEDSLSYTYKAVRLDSLSPATGGHGDFDGDGLQDIIVYNSSDYYIFYGSTIQSSSGILTASDADVEIHFGSGSYEVADIDGDGKDDLAFSTSNAEYSHIFYGSTISSTSNLIPGSNEDVLIWESYGYSHSGHYHPLTSISFIDDLTGDGLPDAIVTGCTTGVVAQSNELGSGGDAYTWSVGTSDIYSQYMTTQLGGLDLDSDGYPDYITSNTSYGYCARDIYNQDGYTYGCNQQFRTFIPTMLLPDIDGDGDKELSDGYCIQNSSNLTDTSYCDYNINHYKAESFIDFDGDGLYDLADSSNITLDIIGGGTGTVTVNYHSVYSSNIADFNGDGMDDLVVSSGGSTYIVGIL
jgi:hypothetical protein